MYIMCMYNCIHTIYSRYPCVYIIHPNHSIHVLASSPHGWVCQDWSKPHHEPHRGRYWRTAQGIDAAGWVFRFYSLLVTAVLLIYIAVLNLLCCHCYDFKKVHLKNWHLPSQAWSDMNWYGILSSYLMYLSTHISPINHVWVPTASSHLWTFCPSPPLRRTPKRDPKPRETPVPFLFPESDVKVTRRFFGGDINFWSVQILAVRQPEILKEQLCEIIS